ncbi:hypothetical protein HAX54_008105, partial [Datura stramonium]|nr:hypothetical protein [Datura stramonium]
MGSKDAKTEVRTTLALPCTRQSHTGIRPGAARPSFSATACARQQHFSAFSRATAPNSSAWAGTRRPNIGARRHAKQLPSSALAGAQQHWTWKNLGATRQGFQN